MITQETPAAAHHRARCHRIRCVHSGHASPLLAHAFNRQRPAVAVGNDGQIARWQVTADAQAIDRGDYAGAKGCAPGFDGRSCVRDQVVRALSAYIGWQDTGWVSTGPVPVRRRRRPKNSQTLRPGMAMALMASFFAVKMHKVSTDRKSTRLNSSHIQKSRMPSSA